MDNSTDNLDKLKLDTNRKRVKVCPCGEANRTHFVPYVGFDDKGYCHKCEKTFLPELQPIENIYYYVSFKKIKEYNEKSFRVELENRVCYLPKSQCLGVTENGCYVSEYILKQYKPPLPYDIGDFKTHTEDITPKPLQRREIAPKIIEKPISLMDSEILKKSLKGYEANHFVSYLISLFGEVITGELISKFYIGTSNHWQGATVFWQIDLKGKVRTGKIMLYDPKTGKRVREPHKCITWVHTALKLNDYNLKQSLFGEHLLKDKNKPIAIVESEKTAIIASVYLPQFIWVAVGSISNLKPERCNVLKGRNVVLFPDRPKEGDKKIPFEIWQEKAKEFSHITIFIVSDFLERKAKETKNKMYGYDLADYLIKFDYRQFTGIEQKPEIITGQQDKTEPQINLLEHYQRMAKDAFKKSYYSIQKDATFHNYLLCWFNDMRVLLHEHGITEQIFFNQIIANNN